MNGSLSNARLAEEEFTLTRRVLFAPSVLGADPLNVAASIATLRGNYDWLHLDIMDGHFVPNLSFGPAMAEALRKRYPEAFLDVHLMLDSPGLYWTAFADAGASLISLHAEAEPQLLHSHLTAIRRRGIKAGVALAPATPAEQVRPVLEVADLVLVMSVTPGFGGQGLIEATLEKTRDLTRWRAVEGYDYLIQMDGGIRRENAGAVAAAGCDVLVMGSALFGAPDPGATLEASRAAVQDALRQGGLRVSCEATEGQSE